MSKIKRLSPEVVNRIAAGEVIQRPANAIKEMLENSLDAGATAISVVLKSGGLKLIQITDNGSGISKEDFSVVCERFATSKLQQFEDLKTIATFGFRGEALASISHVAHVTITSMTANQPCAYKASFCDGKLLNGTEPKPCAGVRGTQIVVEDLFYNVSTRRNALKSPSDEYQRVFAVVSRYAVHNAGVSITLKKFGESQPDIHTQTGASLRDNIRTIFGSKVAKELLPVLEITSQELRFSATALLTNPNYTNKKSEFVLFINNRLVESTNLRRAVEAVYTNYLPRNAHPFVYLSLTIEAQSVDVNVHPTKREVHFLREDRIILAIQSAVENHLIGENTSRSFLTQSLLTPTTIPTLTDKSNAEEKETDSVSSHTKKKQKTAANSEQQQQQQPYNMIRTDKNSQRGQMELYISRQQQSEERAVSRKRERVDDIDSGDVDDDVPSNRRQRESAPHITQTFRSMSKDQIKAIQNPAIELTSVNELIADIESQTQNELSAVFREHVFVGWIDASKSLIQHETRLYIIHTKNISKQLMYQLVLRRFGKMKRIQLNPPLVIAPMITAVIAADSKPANLSTFRSPDEVVQLLAEKADMLNEYFSIGISTNDQSQLVLTSLPQPIDQTLLPPIHRIPQFLYSLASTVDWSEEKNCFHSTALSLADLFTMDSDWLLTASNSTAKEDPPIGNKSESVNREWYYSEQRLRFVTQHVVFPALRLFLSPPKHLATDGSVVQIACVNNLYKIFERC